MLQGRLDVGKRLQHDVGMCVGATRKGSPRGYLDLKDGQGGAARSEIWIGENSKPRVTCLACVIATNNKTTMECLLSAGPC